ncbi:MAG TPA: S8 family serine peptidase, partial [Dehalococcoidia bacterium]|nr:S8 family serine peptidase [Dehalococcoidia bacterium]
MGLPAYPVLNAGSRTTEGDSLLNVDTMRAAYHVNGAGVRVGVISDGIAGFQKSQQSADLPSEIDYQTCNVTPDVDPTSALAGGEGTAMLEIVHDLAPGADLWFGNFGLGSSDHGTVLDFMAAVDCLAAHVDVIVDDVSWFGTGPYDGTSPVSLNTSGQLNDPSNPVRLYTTSVGNWAQRHYHEPYEPCASQNVQTFQAKAGTVDVHGSGPLCYNPITVGPFSIALLSLQWNDPFGASCNDYDLLLKDHNTGDVLASSANPQTCTQDPVEEVAWTNSTVNTVTVDVVVQNPGGLAAPRDFDIFTTAADLGYLTPAGSVPNQGDAAGGVLSVGAIGAFDQGLDSVEPWSSNGPTADGRTKPDLTAVDCVKVTGNSFSSPFCGTSAAAPHIAGIAALLLQCDPALRAGAGDPSGSRALLSSALLQTAQDRGDPGQDNVFGAGLVDPMAAAAVLCPTGGLLGDVDCSTAINAVDALFILRHVTHLTPEPGCLDLGDV